MRTLVFWGHAPLPEALARAARGDRVLLIGRTDAAETADLPSADFGPEAAERIHEAVRSWTDALAERPLRKDERFAELFAWQEVPLWPLAQDFFLSEESVGGRCVRMVEAFSAAFEAELPDEVEAVGLREDEGALLERACTARGVLFQGASRGRAACSTERPARTGLLKRMGRAGMTFASRRPTIGTGGLLLVRPPLGAPRVPARGVTAFERLLTVARDEMSLPVTVLGGEDGIDPVALLDATARRAVEEAEVGFTRALEELKDAPSTAAAFFHEGVSFGDRSAAADLEALLKRVLPQAVRRAEGVRAALRASQAKALCATAADALALRAARAEGTPTVPFGADADGPRVLRALEAAARGAGMVG